jgi:UDP-N-acetylglucosamine 2-epimerase (non-hydrolysing)/GDP/UDP-N,N'-diacetylbacillosamine 2-epimerase (hydrolysing)
MRTIGVVTVGRSDYGCYVPLLRAIQQDPTLRLQLLVGGMHLATAFGLTVEAIAADGFEIADRIDMRLASDTPDGIAHSMGLGMSGFAKTYARQRPDLLLVLGDRFEMFAAAAAAVPFRIPIAHIAGGELTEGAIDNSFRHAMTKLSHLHFVTTETYASRVIQMGEEPWRVTVCGAVGLDHLRTFVASDRRSLESLLGLSLEPAPLLVTYHPVTLEYDRAEAQIDALLEALEPIARPLVFTVPNADTNNQVIRRRIEAFVARHPAARLVPNLGTQAYFSLMAHAAAMVGNSSSGLVEAPSFGLPVVNIGTRQAGRLRAGNVIACGYEVDEIRQAVARAISPEFRQGLTGLRNPYGDGHASARILERLKTVAIDDRLLVKKFHHLSAPEARQDLALCSQT